MVPPAPSLPLPSPLVPARFVRRPNRFVVHARLEPDPALPQGAVPGSEAICHLADPGRLRELLLPGVELLLRYAPAPQRKTEWSVVLVREPDGGEWISLDTTLPNRLVERALEGAALDELAGWTLERTEFARGRSRLDFLLKAPPNRRLALEVKSVTLIREGEALFPDAVTARGARHVEELAEIAGQDGWEAAILFVCQREDADRIRAARSIDPTFAEVLRRGREAGVRILGRRCLVSPERVTLGPPIPVG